MLCNNCLYRAKNADIQITLPKEQRRPTFQLRLRLLKIYVSKTIRSNVPFNFQRKLDISKNGKYFLTIIVEPNTHQMLQQAWSNYPNNNIDLPVWASEFVDVLHSHKNSWDNSLNQNNVSDDQKNIVLCCTDEMHRFFKAPEE